MIDDAALDSWKHDQLANTDALLTAAIATVDQNPSHHALASRALVRARLGQWDAAIADANESIKIQPSVIGYIAKSVALVGKTEKHKAYRACDIAFDPFQPSCVRFLLLIKAIIVFMAGEHDDAISRIDDIISMTYDNSICYVVQAYMYLLLGNLRMESRHYEGAIRSFERAQAQMRPHASQALLWVSLITGWKFDDLGITIRQQLSEALYAASRAKQITGWKSDDLVRQDLCDALYAVSRARQAGESLLRMTHLFNEEVYINKDFIQWVSDFTQRCLVMPESSEFMQRYASARKSGSDAASEPSPLLIEWARATLMMNCSWTEALTASLDFTTPKFTIYRAVCEDLETNDHMLDASKCFLRMVNELAGETTAQHEQAEWVTVFRQRCTEKLEYLGDVAADAQQHDDAITQYSAALSLDLPIPNVFIKRSKAYMAKGLWGDALDDVNLVISQDPSSPFGHENILMEWAKANLKNGLWKDALSASRDFKVPRLVTYRILCEGLEIGEGITDAIECYHQMASELTEEIITQDAQAEWVLDFRYRCSEKMEHFGDAAMDSKRNDEAFRHYSAALSIHLADTPGFVILRSKVCMAKGLWEDAIDEAKQAIALDPSSPRGYEIKRDAFHQAGRYDDAIQTFETILSQMAQSPDPKIRERREQYISPSDTRAQIRKVIQRIIRHSPHVLINTTTGRLQNKAEQTAVFMSLPIVSELVSSMTTRIDRSRIKREVRQFFRYVMLSHKWEENEPLFKQVVHITVYDLDQSPTHDKLQMFCKIVRDAGFHWAWSDTCCINKEDNFVLQESLVAMFKWYRGSVMTIVYLRGVHSPATLGDLVKSIWNTRAWTLQEYVAATVIRFYTEDWTPYLNLDTSNHKESSEIISEMEEATGVSAQQLMALRPGLSNIPEKLRLASTRETTMVEDAAYSLLGIFSVAGIPTIYGEREAALGRLLAHILAGSGDTSILAWTGQPGDFNSCLPAYITVFNRPATRSHFPLPIEDAEMRNIVGSYFNKLDLDLAMKLYDRLNELPAAWFAASRLKLPCIVFNLPPLSPTPTDSGLIYRVETLVFGMVEIKTKEDMSRLDALYLVHPWLDAVLGREDMQNDVSAEDDPSSLHPDDEDISDEEIDVDVLPRPAPESQSRVVPIEAAPMGRETRALRLVARLRRPFGALLFTLASTRRRAVEYRRVAADSMITVQIQENVTLTDVLDNIRTLDVL
ncbi:protein prenylyltransferase, partial [Imleria badia]